MIQNKSGTPRWLRKKLPGGSAFRAIHETMDKQNLHTVCREALCPNRWECNSAKTAAFLILGRHCTRNCPFCNISGKSPEPVDLNEPARVAQMAYDMGLKYVVVTSVTRDDLPDGGAAIFSDTIKVIRQKIPGVLIEVLIPDFQGDPAALQTVVDAFPDVINHNVETVPRLYPRVRPGADYDRSLGLLRHVNAMDDRIILKSGILLGMSERGKEVLPVFSDLVAAGCRLLSIGQYLAPSREHLPVYRYIRPRAFETWQRLALDAGFSGVAAGPFVRSSYNAREMCLKLVNLS
jgi:lipoyl synthase